MDDFRSAWEAKKARNALIREGGCVSIRIAGKRYQVVAPNHPAFLAGVMSWTGVRWRHRSGMWSIPCWHRFKLRALITECFGAEKVPEWMRTDRPRKET